MDNNEQLYHHGIKGMKWGIRRFQRKDGSLTPAGEKRRDQREGRIGGSSKGSIFKRKASSKPVEKAPEQPKKKKLEEMSDDEIRAAIARKQLENQYKQLNPDPPQKVSFGKEYIKTFGKKMLVEAVMPAAVGAGKKFMENALGEMGNNYVNKYIKPQKQKTEKEKLQEEYDKLKLKTDIAKLKNPKESLSDAVARLTKEKRYKELTGEDWPGATKKKDSGTTVKKDDKSDSKPEIKGRESTDTSDSQSSASSRRLSELIGKNARYNKDLKTGEAYVTDWIVSDDNIRWNSSMPSLTTPKSSSSILSELGRATKSNTSMRTLDESKVTLNEGSRRGLAELDTPIINLGQKQSFADKFKNKLVSQITTASDDKGEPVSPSYKPTIDLIDERSSTSVSTFNPNLVTAGKDLIDSLLEL